ncbi:SH2 domain-containing protein 2A [Eleutherodactylus coqui]|uniref:SH2 domain-containing protein 2A n=1 Tax=Eleutherodactylus coqui TaxID=57060 RepID=UPI003462B167
MAYDYQKDYPSITFSTFKSIPESRDVPNSDTACHEEGSQTKETDAEANNKITDSSSTNSVHKESRNTGVTLKDQTYHWFERTQRKKLLKNGRFADWFHGFTTRTRAEEILQDKPLGCFLIRFCESRVGFVLSYRGAERCRHFMLHQLEDGQYVIEGEESVHPSLEDLVNHYSRCPVEPYRETLTAACPLNPFQNKVSSLTQPNPHDAAAGSQMYARISKQNGVPPDATCPKERSKIACEGRTPVEYASPSSVRKVPMLPRREAIPMAVDPEPHLPHAPDDGSDLEVMSPPADYASETSHTYSEPDLWDRARVEGIDNGSEPIAFYAVGRGSCKDISENVYSEVDMNSVTSGKSRAAMNSQGGLFTLPHPVPKAVTHKTTAFHSSFRSHKPSAAPPEDTRQGLFSRCKTKPHVTIQLEDPKYGQGHLQHRAAPHPEEENVYEKIPDNCAATLRSNHPGRKAR